MISRTGMGKIKNFLEFSGVVLGLDGIYSGLKNTMIADQSDEKKLREKVAAQHYEDYLSVISKHHSIPVMDHEVDRFLKRMPENALILDIGGCWGWHWRRIGQTRPDIAVLIIDFVRENLVHAQRLLEVLVGSQVALMHADATSLPFPEAGSPFPGADGIFPGFDAIWTVQTFQHIPDFERAVSEVHRVLKPGGRFINYSLHNTSFNRAIYRLLGKRFHSEGMMRGQYHLIRANDRQRQIVAAIFGKGGVVDRYTECLFHPDLKFALGGRKGSLLGWLDSWIGGQNYFCRFFGRQRSFEAIKTDSLRMS